MRYVAAKIRNSRFYKRERFISGYKVYSHAFVIVDANTCA
jgi:hypothetical protein